MSTALPITPTPAAGAPGLSAAGTPGLSAAGTPLPAAVREGSPQAKQAYQSASGFEEMLLEQVTQSMLAGSGEGAEAGEESVEAGAGEEAPPLQEGGGMLSSLLPQALAEGVSRHGGIGLAGQLLDSLDPAAARPSRALSGGTPA